MLLRPFSHAPSARGRLRHGGFRRRPDAPRFGEIMDDAKQQQAVRSQNRVLHIVGGRCPRMSTHARSTASANANAWSHWKPARCLSPIAAASTDCALALGLSNAFPPASYSGEAELAEIELYALGCKRDVKRWAARRADGIAHRIAYPALAHLVACEHLRIRVRGLRA
jgi:hypothetical protein